MSNCALCAGGFGRFHGLIVHLAKTEVNYNPLLFSHNAVWTLGSFDSSGNRLLCPFRVKPDAKPRAKGHPGVKQAESIPYALGFNELSSEGAFR